MPRRLRARAFFLALLFVAATPCLSPAQSQKLSSDEPEAWAMFWFASATSFSGIGVPRSREPGSVDLFVDLGELPELDERQRTVGFGGTKTEDLNKAPAWARPGLVVGLPWNVSFAVGYVPPVKLFGVKASLVSLALERPLYEEGPWSVGARLHTQFGKIRGDFTCPKQVARFGPGSSQNPYGCETVSNDSAVQRSLGIELSASYRLDALWKIAPYLVVGGTWLDTEFEVHAQTFGFRDRTHMEADTMTFNLGAGATIPLGERFRFGAGVFYTPLWVTRPPSTNEDRDSLVQARAEITCTLR